MSLIPVDHHFQDPGAADSADQYCGPACVQMIASAFGVVPQEVDGIWTLQQKDILKVSGHYRGNNERADGNWASYPDSLVIAANQAIASSWPPLGPLETFLGMLTRSRPPHIEYHLTTRLAVNFPDPTDVDLENQRDILAFIRRAIDSPGKPSILAVHGGEHFIVVNGYEEQAGNVEFYEAHDPAPELKTALIPHRSQDSCSNCHRGNCGPVYVGEVGLIYIFEPNSRIGLGDGQWYHKYLAVVPSLTGWSRVLVIIDAAWKAIQQYLQSKLLRWPGDASRWSAATSKKKKAPDGSASPDAFFGDPAKAREAARVVFPISQARPAWAAAIKDSAPAAVFNVRSPRPGGLGPYCLVVMEKDGQAVGWVIVSAADGQWLAARHSSGPWPVQRLSDKEVLDLASRASFTKQGETIKYTPAAGDKVALELEWDFSAPSRTPFLPYYRLDTVQHGKLWLDWQGRLLGEWKVLPPKLKK